MPDKQQNAYRLSLPGCFLAALLGSSLAIAQGATDGDEACQTFESTRAAYTESLTIQLAWTLIGAAEDCLLERTVAFDRISTYALRITPDADVEPGKTAALIETLTDGAVIYDVGFFLRKPFAAGGFEQNTLFLPHSAVLGKLDMVARHELNHARAHSLWLNNDQRLRHLWIFADDTMYVDEVLAYAEGAINEANAERMRSWSLDMAHQYIAGTRKLIAAAEPVFATAMEGQRFPMTKALKAEVSNMLDCIEDVLQSAHPEPADISACDGPRAQPYLHTPEPGAD